MKEIEILDKRKEREKHFLKENGDIVAHVYDEDIHFLKDGKFEEIDNTLIDDDEYYTNKENAYKVWFNKNSKTDIMQMETKDHYINIRLREGNNTDIIKNDISSKLSSSVSYNEILNNINFDYKVLSNKVKECIILKDRDADIDKLEFIIDTDLELLINADKTISALKDGIEVFKIEAPYMIDSNSIINNGINYLLSKENNEYILKIKINRAWLDTNTTIYPVIIDPTITNSGQENSVYDTYIYSGDTGVDRNSKEYLKIGVERVNNVDVINRALLKFELPTIGTGSQIIDAQLTLRGYPDTTNTHIDTILNVHRVTQDWDETDANWSEMNDKYDSRVEGVFYSTRMHYYDSDGNIILFMAGTELTNLVKKWYADTPNYGILIKENKEVYTNDAIPMFFSKNNSVSGGNPKPLLSVTYRNQNGLESYMDYQSQSFKQGKMYHNNYNGNVTGIFNVGSTIKGKMPVDLKLVYNTNDVILNENIGCGIGNRFNLSQTICSATEIESENTEYLKYVDEDGTIHYFLNQKVKYDETNGFVTTDYENTFFDEDGLDLVIERSSTDYIMKDKYNNQKKFTIINGIGYLSEIVDVSGNKVVILYDTNNRIIKVVDANDEEINLNYTDEAISIQSKDQTVTLNYNNSCLISIVSIFGTTTFTINSENLITSVIDVNGEKIKYEYYEQNPYRVKKISEYSINNTLGNYYEISYGYNATTIIDNKNKAKTITFNNYGNPVSISSLKSNDDVKNAYGIQFEYGEILNGVNTYNNKLLSNQIPLKYVKNLLKDSSFENDTINFTGQNSIVLSISTENYNSGAKSLEIYAKKGGVTATQSISVPKGENYTFSAYLKTDFLPMNISLSYTDADGNVVESKSENILSEENFERYDVTIFYPETAISDLIITFIFEYIGMYYIDDVQLEEGEVANNYNMLENSDFSDGATGWTLTATDETDTDITDNVFEIVNINSDTAALKVKMDPANYSSFSQSFKINGKAGDQYTISFWYKNEGFMGAETMGIGSYNNVSFNFNPIEEQQTDLMVTKTFNPNEKEWQYFSQSFTAPWDFDILTVDFWQSLNANNLYVTNLNLFKDVRSVTYDYDENGNIILSKSLNNESNLFNYDKNNQLINMTNARGKNFTFEYDNTVTDRLIRSVSGTGISNEIEYNLDGNPIRTKIINRGQNFEIEDGTYNIRLKGTNKSIRLIDDVIEILDNNCGHDKWILEKTTENDVDYFKIKHYILNKYLTVLDGSLILSTSTNSGSSLFKLIKNDSGSYLIQNKDNLNYIKYENTITLSELIENDVNFEFYFERLVDDIFLENSAEYTTNGKFIKNITDTNFNKTIYDIDESTGLINSITNAKGQTTYYNYNDKRQLTSVIQGSKTLNYEYNSQNLISKIIQGNRIYNLNYDEFLNMTSITIGNDITLITKNYEANNGNILSTIYGNNNIITYDYDDFNRIKTLTKMDDVYKYKYGNNGDLVKIISNNDITKYVYDLDKRIYEYRFNEFQIKYGYDTNNNVISKHYKLINDLDDPNDDVNETLEHNIQNTFNDDDIISKIVIDISELNYNYDSLGRIANSNINNSYNKNYEYMTNGKRTSLLVKAIDNNNDRYSYRYDKLDNITHVYHNSVLENEYYYDEDNQLVKENDYLKNETIRYKYDNLGNILLKKVCELNTYNQLSQNKYEYGNVEWPDQMTKFNDNVITYDAIGNPLTIGENITLKWLNGRQLSEYIDGTNVISYKYNQDGIRTSKIINNVETKYFLEDSRVIIEKTGDDVLYYIHSDVDGIIGFKYNEDLYYYIKNIHNDIIGMIDSQYNIIAKYKYDSWGNILSIVDADNNDVANDLTHIANINSFRYRSYYYDKETKLYYLNSRYYNPAWGRFVNADNIINSNNDLLSHNLYIYCSNDPINRVDSQGHGWLSNLWNGIKKIGAGIANAVQKTVKVVQDIVSAIKNAFTLDVGVGFGTEAGSNVAGGGYYNDKTLKIEDGQVKTGNAVGLYAEFKPTDTSIGTEYFHTPHFVDGDIDESINHSQFMPLITHIKDCPETETSFSAGVKTSDTTLVEYDTAGTYFVGLEFSLHVGVGGHIKIGFNIPWDWN